LVKNAADISSADEANLELCGRLDQQTPGQIAS
jgi:hypothetical protein